MSDDVLSVIPTDPQWQPDPLSADRAAALATELAPEAADGVDVEVEVTWNEVPTFVDCGQNLEKIGCPLCQALIDVGWLQDLMEAHADDGLPLLVVAVPCCGGETSLDALDYSWPCGFARFEIAIWNPDRAWFDDDELNAIGAALGHPVRQIRAHI
ncbi:hypothetical protein ACQEU3_37550 [Spirillospora sp. CA-253888]